MPERTKYELPSYSFRTPEVFKQAEISRIKGGLKARKRYQSMAERYAKQQRDYEYRYQVELALELRKLL